MADRIDRDKGGGPACPAEASAKAGRSASTTPRTNVSNVLVGFGQSCRTAAAVRSTPTHECRKSRAAIHRVDFRPRVLAVANQLKRFVPCDGCRIEEATSRRAASGYERVRFPGVRSRRRLATGLTEPAVTRKADLKVRLYDHRTKGTQTPKGRRLGRSDLLGRQRAARANAPCRLRRRRT
jgi:hypothetical protein